MRGDRRPNSQSATQRASELVEQLRADGSPRKTTTSITRNHRSFQTTLMKRAMRESEQSLEDPGQVDQIWFSDEGMLVLDLNGGKR